MRSNNNNNQVNIAEKDALNANILAAIERNDHDKLIELTLPEEVLVKDLVILTMTPGPDSRDTPFIRAAANGYYSVVHYLLWLAKRYPELVDLDMLDKKNKNALMRAAEGGHEKVVELLLKNGSDPRITYHDPKQKFPPVSVSALAREKGFTVIAEKLESAANEKNIATVSIRNSERFLLYTQPEPPKPDAESASKKRRVVTKKQKNSCFAC